MEHSQRAARRRPDALSTGELARRLAELAGDERQVQVDFLLHLDAFDRRRAWLEAGFGSLWDYCREKLHLSEGAAGRRTNAMRVLRRFPRLEPALRDGRLSLTTVTLLAPVLDEANLDALVARAAYGSKVDVQRIVASLQPLREPRQGIRLVSAGAGAATVAPAGTVAVVAAAATTGQGCTMGAPGAPDASAAGEAARPSAGGPDVVGAPPVAGGKASSSDGHQATPPAPPLVLVAPPAPPRDELRPIDAERWSVRVTLDGRAKADLDLLADLLSHKTGRDLGAVVHEAIRCALEKHGKRRGAVAPQRARKREPTVPQRSSRPGTPELARAKAPLHVAAAAAPVPAAATALDAKADEARPSAPTRGAAPASATAPAPLAAPAPDTARFGTRPLDPRAIPIAVRRAVHARDGGRCTYVSPDGRRCGSRWKLELHHREPAARGGPPTAENLTLRCKAHNLLAAERDFGAAHMARFTRRDPRVKEEVAPYRAIVQAPAAASCCAAGRGPAP